MIIKQALTIATLIGGVWGGSVAAHAQSVAVDNDYVYVVRGNTLYQYSNGDMKLLRQTTLPAAKGMRTTRQNGHTSYSTRQRVVRSHSPRRGRTRGQHYARTQRLVRVDRLAPLPP